MQRGCYARNYIFCLWSPGLYLTHDPKKQQTKTTHWHQTPFPFVSLVIRTGESQNKSLGLQTGGWRNPVLLFTSPKNRKCSSSLNLFLVIIQNLLHQDLLCNVVYNQINYDTHTHTHWHFSMRANFKKQFWTFKIRPQYKKTVHGLTFSKFILKYSCRLKAKKTLHMLQVYYMYLHGSSFLGTQNFHIIQFPTLSFAGMRPDHCKTSLCSAVIQKLYFESY